MEVMRRQEGGACAGVFGVLDGGGAVCADSVTDAERGVERDDKFYWRAEATSLCY